MNSFAEIKEQARKLGKSIGRMYIDTRKNNMVKLAKKIPLLYNAIFNKRYILPNWREKDYVNQEACDYFMFDMMLAMAQGEDDFRKSDEVLNTEYVAMVRQIEFNRPTFFLERELGEPMVKTRLPDNYFVSDIKWKFPAFRVYLPRDLLCIERNGKSSSLMFLDITRIQKECVYDLSESIRKEIKAKLGYCRLPPFRNTYDGFGVSGNLHFDDEDGCVGYAGSSPIDGVTMKKLTQFCHEYDMNKAFPSDQIDKVFVNKMLALGINILLYLSSYPIEYEPKKDMIRAPRQEGKRTLSGLYKARFVGESQLRPYKPSKPGTTPVAPTGMEIAAHWVSGHWKRIWFGIGKKEHRLQWVGLYHTKEKENNT